MSAGERLQPQVEDLVALLHERLEAFRVRDVRPVVVQDPDLGGVGGAQRDDAADHGVVFPRT